MNDIDVNGDKLQWQDEVIIRSGCQDKLIGETGTVIGYTSRNDDFLLVVHFSENVRTRAESSSFINIEGKHLGKK